MAKKTEEKIKEVAEVTEASSSSEAKDPEILHDVQNDMEVAEKKPAAKKATPKKAAAKAEKAEKSAKGKTKLKNSEKKHARKYREAGALLDNAKEYTVEEAMELLTKTATTKFDSSTEIHIRLNVDPQNSEQQVRGSIVLPNGTGRTKRVLAIVSPEKEKEAKDAGADFVGGEDMIAKVADGWLDFDIVVATPDMMPKLGKIGKTLGTKGLMPNPKVGTVTPNVAGVVKDIKKGMVEYRVDKAGIIHLAFGKVSFGDAKLAENYNTLLETINSAKPNGVKGTYIKGVAVASTMGPGIKIKL